VPLPSRPYQQPGSLGGLPGGPSASAALDALSAREHAPGVRRRGCPCCDPDDPENAADMMMML
jgi:hypothetical protein